MRKQLFEKNYTLLKRLIPELLSENIPDFWLDYEDDISPFANISAERLTENLIDIGTYYVVNGDVASDPSISVLFCNERQIARVFEITMNNPGMCLLGKAFYEMFENAWDSLDSDETEFEKEINDYLHDWLSDFVDDERRRYSDCFTKRKTSHS